MRWHAFDLHQGEAARERLCWDQRRYPMPADVVPAIAAIVSAFLVFMAALGFVSVWSNMGDKAKD